MKKLPYTILAVLVFSMSMLSAQDVASTEGEEILFANQFLSVIASALLAGLTFGLTWAGNKLKKYLVKAGLEQETIEELETQVSLMYHNEVREVKIALGDGSISRDDALDFRRRVRTNLIDILKGPVKDFAVGKGKDWVSGKIEDIISAKKRK